MLVVQMEAQQSLQYALAHCSQTANTNKLLIMKFLLPASYHAQIIHSCQFSVVCGMQVQMLLGALPVRHLASCVEPQYMCVVEVSLLNVDLCQCSGHVLSILISAGIACWKCAYV